MSGSLEEITIIQTSLLATPLHHSDGMAAYHQVVEELNCYRNMGRIAQNLRQALHPTEVLKQAVETVRQLLSVDGAVLYRFQTEEDAIAAFESTAHSRVSILFDPVDQATARGLTEIFQQLSLFIIDSSIDDSHSTDCPIEIRRLMQQHRAKAALITVIQWEGDLIGIICAYQIDHTRHWKTFEAEALQQLSTEVAIALQQAALYQEAKQLNAQVQERTVELKRSLDFESMLRRITDKVRDSLDENSILQAAVEELTLGLKLGGCNASLYDWAEGTSTIRYEYIHSIPTYWGRVAQMANFPEAYQQLQQGQYFQFCSLLPNPARGRVSTLACPIFVDTKSAEGMEQNILGDLWLIHHEDYIYTEFEIRLVEQVANQCAIAIRQARLYQTSQVQVQELEKLNRLKDEFLSTVSHELRTPIANVKMAIKMLRLAPTEEKRNQYLDILDEQSLREAELINDLLEFQRLEGTSCSIALQSLQLHPVVLQPLQLQAWLLKLVEPFQAQFLNREQTFSLDLPENLPTLLSDVIILRRILFELLNNACKYTASGGKICLKVTHETSDRPAIIFQVGNRAHIPKEELTKVFNKFYRCPNADPWSQGGTGLGLALVDNLVKQLQGAIAVNSQNDWTTFTVKHPMRTD
jgi:signal transduction histidine kinase